MNQTEFKLKIKEQTNDEERLCKYVCVCTTVDFAAVVVVVVGLCCYCLFALSL